MNSKLLKVQGALKAPKGQYNSFGGYKYRSAEDILEAVKPLLVEQGLVLTLSDEVVEVGGRVYVMAHATIKDGDQTVASVRAYAREAETKKGMDVSQVTGTASSYARKYALNGLFLIDDAKDPDTDAYTAQTAEEETINASQAKRLVALAKANGHDSDWLLETLKVSRLSEVTPRQYAEIAMQLSNDK